MWEMWGLVTFRIRRTRSRDVNFGGRLLRRSRIWAGMHRWGVWLARIWWRWRVIRVQIMDIDLNSDQWHIWELKGGGVHAGWEWSYEFMSSWFSRGACLHAQYEIGLSIIWHATWHPRAKKGTAPWVVSSWKYCRLCYISIWEGKRDLASAGP